MIANLAHRAGGAPGRGRQLLRQLIVPLFAYIAAAAAPVQAATRASHFVLDNGMQVVVVPDHRVPVVTHQVWYKAGAAEDPAGRPGVAHFLEHLMFKGTERFPGNSFERFVVANGGASINAFTTQDHTVYPQSLPKKHLAKLMELEADRMVNLRFNEEQVVSERRVVQNERRGNENSPTYLLVERINAALYPKHPYSRSVIGVDAEIQALDRASALGFYQRHYAPNNAILVVAGDVTESEVRSLAEKTFGQIPRRDIPRRLIHRLPDRPLTTRVELEHERTTTPVIGYYYYLPRIGAMPRADVHALTVLIRIAGTSIIGRLNRELVLTQRLALSASASWWSSVRGGTLSFWSEAAPGVSIADLEAALGGELAGLGRDGVTEAEVDDAKRGILAAKAYEDDNHRLRATAYGTALAEGRSVADVEAANDLVARVTVADVNRLASRLIAKSEPVIGVLRPQVQRAVVPSPAVTK